MSNGLTHKVNALFKRYKVDLMAKNLELAEAELEDGTLVSTEGDEFAAGQTLYVATEEGNQPAPAGEHTLNDGRVLVVDENSVITEVKPGGEPAAEEAPAAVTEEAPVAAEEAPAPMEEDAAAHSEAMAQMAARIAELEAKIAELEAMLANKEEVVTELKKVKSLLSEVETKKPNTRKRDARKNRLTEENLVNLSVEDRVNHFYSKYKDFRKRN